MVNGINVTFATRYEMTSIDEQIVWPDEPDTWEKLGKEHYWENEAKRYAGNADYWRERAEKAEQANRRMVELMKEPSEAMWSAVWVSIKVPPLQRARSVLSVHDLRLLWAAFHQAMSAELLKEVGE